MNKLFVVLPVLFMAAIVPMTVAAEGTLHFKPEKGAIVKANTFLAINGTSAPSNDTRTKCNVQFQTNGHGYKAVTALGPNSAITKNGGLPDFTKWSTTTSEQMKPGINQLEGQIECFPATGNTTAPNFLHHLVHNVTAQ